MGAQQGKSIDEMVFDMKFQSKMLTKYSAKAEKEEAKSKKAVLKAIERGNKEAAQIHAQNAIRQKHEAHNYLLWVICLSCSCCACIRVGVMWWRILPRHSRPV